MSIQRKIWESRIQNLPENEETEDLQELTFITYVPYKNEKEIGIPFKNDIFGHDENAGLLERQFGLSPIDNISNSEANR